MSYAGSLRWFAVHELRLAWRDWSWLFRGRIGSRTAGTILVVLILAVGLHGLAYYVLNAHLSDGFTLSRTAIVVLSSSAVLAFTMMLSQALEMVTRAFYARDDLDLILSSPSPAGDLFTVRLVMLAASNAVVSGLFVAPFINVAVLLDGTQWLSGYAVVLSLSMVSTALATGIVLFLFKTIGPRRTRLFAQIAAAVISASFLIGIQALAIVGFGSVSRWTVLSSDWLHSQIPDLQSHVWIISYAILGNSSALTCLLIAATVTLAVAAWGGSQLFCAHVLAATSLGEGGRKESEEERPLRVRSTHFSLIMKEWRLLARDPWLLSQSLMQVFYLIPPGLMLWVTYGENNPMSAIVGPVIVMAISQLAGGLAWLAISGEDAPDLLATSPVTARVRTVSKVVAVLGVVQFVALPFVLGMALLSTWGALATLLGTIVGASSAIAIQMMFHVPSSRSMFRRRQVSSKAATFCEAFAAIICAAGTGVLAAHQYALTSIPVVFLILVLLTAWLLRARH